MTELSKKILQSYQSRKTKKQKERFLQYICSYLDQQNIPYQIDVQGKFLKSKNLIVGNLEKPKVVCTAHYDTQAVLPIPNFITPFSWTGIALMNLLLLAIIYVVAVFLEGLFCLWDPILFEGSYSLFWWVGFLYIYFGIPNPHTANDNTSGVILLLELIQSLDSYDDACFVFFDLEEVGLVGSKRFEKKHYPSIKYATVINYDCISDGDTFFLKLSHEEDGFYDMAHEIFTPIEGKEALITTKGFYPTDAMHFSTSISCAALRKRKNLLYLSRIHTLRDTIFETKNIEWFKDKTLQYIKKKKGDETI